MFFEYGLPANNVAIRLYQRGFGGSEILLGEVKTDDQGHYTIPYDIGDKPTNLEVRLPDANGQEIILSESKIDAGKT